MKYENVLIEKIDHLGNGIARINGKVVFVKNALPGEVVNLEIEEVHKKYDEGISTKIIKASDERREVKCPYFNECGGCDLLHMNYESQVKFKKDKVVDIIKKYANLEVSPIVIKSNKEYNYRNKITLHYKENKLGFYKGKTHKVIEIDKCLIANEKINEVIKNINLKDKNIILRTNNKEVIYDKNDTIIKQIKDYKFKIHLDSFFQINDFICEQIFNLIEENINENEIVLDLYSGVSTLSIVASTKVKEVYSIEENYNSYLDALDNIKLNNRKNVRTIESKVEDMIKGINRVFTTVIVDPPRKGLDISVINFLLSKKQEKIIYISCDPMTLARDLNYLKRIYEIKNFYILDMFPNTYHVECACILKLK